MTIKLALEASVCDGEGDARFVDETNDGSGGEVGRATTARSERRLWGIRRVKGGRRASRS